MSPSCPRFLINRMTHSVRCSGSNKIVNLQDILLVSSTVPSQPNPRLGECPPHSQGRYAWRHSFCYCAGLLRCCVIADTEWAIKYLFPTILSLSLWKYQQGPIWIVGFFEVDGNFQLFLSKCTTLKWPTLATPLHAMGFVPSSGVFAQVRSREPIIPDLGRISYSSSSQKTQPT